MVSRSDASRLYDDAVEFEPTRRTRVKTLRTFALTSLLTLASWWGTPTVLRARTPPVALLIATSFIAGAKVRSSCSRASCRLRRQVGDSQVSGGRWRSCSR